jgi:hypothetical protein
MENNIKTAKQIAKQLSKAIATLATGQTIDHSVMLEIVAKGFGKRNWHTFLAEQDNVPQATLTPLVTWTPLKGQMTDVQYRAHPTCCPVCGSDDIEGDSTSIDNGGCWQEVSCSNCASTWNDTYSLTGFAELDAAPKYLTPAYAEVFAIQQLLLKQEISPEDILPDWIIDVCVEGVTPSLNNTSEAKAQDALITTSEQRGADILNYCEVDQLHYLRSQYPSISLFMQALSEKTDMNLTTAML